MAPPEWLAWLNENLINPLYGILINPLRDNIFAPLLTWLLRLLNL